MNYLHILSVLLIFQAYITVKAYDSSLNFLNSTDEELPNEDIHVDNFSDKHIIYDDSIDFRNHSNTIGDSQLKDDSNDNITTDSLINNTKSESSDESSEKQEEELNAHIEEDGIQDEETQDKEEVIEEEIELDSPKEILDEDIDVDEDEEILPNEIDDNEMIDDQDDLLIDEDEDDYVKTDPEQHYDEEEDEEEQPTISPPSDDDKEIGNDKEPDRHQNPEDETSNPVTLISTCFVLLTLGALIL